MNKVLLVEDDLNLGIMIHDLLELSGYEVKLLRLADQTIKCLQQDQFDLVIMDKLLNGMDGTVICSEIRKTDTISDTPVPMMSALDGAKTLCIKAGATNFISKPFEIEDLLAKVKDVIRHETDIGD
ncbi:response regulator transcription factor [Subsaximicrobium wynnwilliamsii]|uniref:Response regulator transcription factor n=1 Tax=Subsaximicrobium wynnwilliamsii TaxID=291179 RepID=A0A5C6ZLK8_9FLAO|nr:response regulator [Subsaximicrobium wynnwilliamsii]TXD85576.1 response regulator transcription factor [Subsaximicrobium wynnwilliamsii]TXD90929.1 response regulator transcription factor [Subsaximicrobium wynnwilliamsii]TXE05436.1 response regulator transcription factor [Subsaximicrobium wynnwilliamsii]